MLFDRSWYNRAGVERVMGFCTEEEYREFPRSCPVFEKMLIRSGSSGSSIGFGGRRGTGEALSGTDEQPNQKVEAEPDGSSVAQALGGLLAGEGRVRGMW
jgi:Polyphosphate kinase 2 (PPK2)